MKKTKILFIIISTALCIITITVAYFYNVKTVHNQQIEIEADFVDNSSNNWNANNGIIDLLIIKENLVYNYPSNSHKNGTYLITEKSFKKIYGKPLDITYETLRMIGVYNNELLCDSGINDDNNCLYYFNFDSFDIELLESIKIPKALSKNECNYCLINNTIYIVDENENYYLYEKGKTKLVNKKGIKGDYIGSYGFEVYYFDKEKIYSLNLKTGNVEKKYSINGLTIDTAIILSDEIYFSCRDFQNSKIYRLDNNGCVEIYNTDALGCINGINNTLFFSDLSSNKSAMGLYMINSEQREPIKISNEKLDNIYIFDSQWIYYKGFSTSDIDRPLYRITQDGKITEKVFG